MIDTAYNLSKNNFALLKRKQRYEHVRKLYYGQGNEPSKPIKDYTKQELKAIQKLARATALKANRKQNIYILLVTLFSVLILVGIGAYLLR